MNVRTVTEEINQYDDLLQLFLDPPQQYNSKIEDSQQKEGDSWFNEVDQNKLKFKLSFHNYIQDHDKNRSTKS